MKALIPAAGHGTRFAPWTKLVPKEMLPVGSRPAIAQIVDEAVEAGADEVVIVTSPEKPLLKKWFEIEPAHVKIAWLDRQLAKLVTGGTLWGCNVIFMQRQSPFSLRCDLPTPAPAAPSRPSNPAASVGATVLAL